MHIHAPIKASLIAATLLILAGLSSSIIMEGINDMVGRKTVEEKLYEDSIGVGDGYVTGAVSLLTEGTLSGVDHIFFGAVPTGPVYPAFVALAFLLGGVDMRSLWALQRIVFIATAILLFFLMRRFLDARWAGGAALLFALFWGAALYVFQPNNEILSLFLVVGASLSIVRYLERGRLYELIAGAILLALLALTKPIFEYFIFVSACLLALFLFFVKKERSVGLLHLATFLVIPTLLVGGWHIRNQHVFGTLAISTGGHALYLHALSTAYGPATFKGFLVSAALGDFFADMIVPGYALHPEPVTSIRRVFNQERMAQKRAGISEFELDRLYWQEGKRLLFEHPVRFFLVAPAWFLRLNSVPSQTGGMIEHLFVGTHTGVPLAVRAAIILLVRGMWYTMIAASFVGGVLLLYRQAAHNSAYFCALWIIAFILYTNAMYSLFAHAEVRYAVPLMPFYFLFFAVFLERWYKVLHKRPAHVSV